jgi:hypothetical protein
MRHYSFFVIRFSLYATMSFLTPIFLLGLTALAVPIVIHLTQRERKTVVEFPSLMFVRRIPYQSVRRRRIRHWALLLLRVAALALIVSAFARPFLRRQGAAGAGGSGAREVVILIDRSYSMDYGDRWARARAAVRDAVTALAPSDRASIVLFASEPEVAVRSTSERARLLAAVDAAQPGAGATRYAPALKLAGSILSESQLPRREAILVSDFQRRGWESPGGGGAPPLKNDGVRLPDGAKLTPISIAPSTDPGNSAVTPVALQRSRFENQERIAVTAGVKRRGSPADLDVTLEVGERAVQTERVHVDADGSASVTFAPLSITSPSTRATVRLGADALARDNAFHVVLSAAEPVRVIVMQRAAGANLYLSRALSIGEAPRFDTSVKQDGALSADDLRRVAVVVLDNVPVGAALAASLARFVEAGGGLLVALGERASWPSNVDLLPGRPAGFVDRSRGDAGRLGALEYGHAMFEVFRAPRSGDFSAARFYGYREIVGRAFSGPPGSRDQILARFDDGTPALLERKVGRGRVLMWASTLDLAWNDLALKPVYLPFVHRAMRHLAAYAEPPAWRTVGEVIAPEVAGAASTVALTPSGRRVALDEEGHEVLELSEQGFYELRQGKGAGPARTVASNIDLTESDLTPVDPREIVMAVSSPDGGGPGHQSRQSPDVTREMQERAQRVWWYLLFAGILLLGVETVVSGRVSRPGGAGVPPLTKV